MAYLAGRQAHRLLLPPPRGCHGAGARRCRHEQQPEEPVRHVFKARVHSRGCKLPVWDGWVWRSGRACTPRKHPAVLQLELRGGRRRRRGRRGRRRPELLLVLGDAGPQLLHLRLMSQSMRAYRSGRRVTSGPPKTTSEPLEPLEAVVPDPRSPPGFAFRLVPLEFALHRSSRFDPGPGRCVWGPALTFGAQHCGAGRSERAAPGSSQCAGVRHCALGARDHQIVAIMRGCA